LFRAAPNAIVAPNFKFEDMGIGGLDAEFSSIFRRAFASRVFPPGLVEKLGIQHVKGKLDSGIIYEVLLVPIKIFRHIAAWSSGYGKDIVGTSDWQDA